MSEREYSANVGLSRGAIQKARKHGRLVLHSDGSINAAASDARRAAMTDPDQQQRARAGFGGTVSGRDGEVSGSVSSPGDSTSYLKARTALTVYQVQDKQLAIQKRKGSLVDRARAETLVFRLARQERNSTPLPISASRLDDDILRPRVLMVPKICLGIWRGRPLPTLKVRVE